MRIFSFILLLCLLAALVPAQRIFIPSNSPSTGSSNAIPFSSSFMKTNCGYQALYFAKYLKGQPWRMKEMSFAPNFTTAFSCKNLTIKLSHFKGSSLGNTLANNIPSPITVYNGAFTWKPVPNTWNTIGLQNTFSYNGTDNIVIDLRYQGGTGGGSCRYDSGHIPRNWTYSTHTGVTPSGSDPRAGLKTRFTVEVITLTASGAPSIGGTVNLNLSAPVDAGIPYQVASSLGQGPIPLGTRSIPLSVDGLLEITVKGVVPWMFSKYQGLLDAQGTAVASVNIPNISGLIGVRFYSAFLTIKAGSPYSIKSISPAVPVTITK